MTSTRRPHLTRAAAAAAGLGTLPWAGRASSPAPPEWRRSTIGAMRSPYGALAVVTLRNKAAHHGELIEISGDAVILGSGARLDELPGRCIDHLRVAAHEPGPELSVVSGFGLLSTLTHGFFLGVTAPLWAATWGLATCVDAQISYPRYGPRYTPLPEARTWARFPQGLPPALAAVAPRRALDPTSCRFAAPRPAPGPVAPAR